MKNTPELILVIKWLLFSKARPLVLEGVPGAVEEGNDAVEGLLPGRDDLVRWEEEVELPGVSQLKREGHGDPRHALAPIEASSADRVCSD